MGSVRRKECGVSERGEGLEENNWRRGKKRERGERYVNGSN